MFHGEWQTDPEGIDPEETKFIDIQVALSPTGQVKLRPNECKHDRTAGNEQTYDTPEAALQDFSEFLNTGYSGGPQA